MEERDRKIFIQRYIERERGEAAKTNLKCVSKNCKQRTNSVYIDVVARLPVAMLQYGQETSKTDRLTVYTLAHIHTHTCVYAFFEYFRCHTQFGEPLHISCVQTKTTKEKNSFNENVLKIIKLADTP